MSEQLETGTADIIIFAETQEELEAKARQHGITPEKLGWVTLVTPGCDMSRALSQPRSTPWHRMIDWSPSMVRQNDQLWEHYGSPISACSAFNRLNRAIPR